MATGATLEVDGDELNAAAGLPGTSNREETLRQAG
jgi:hypothetical protein